MRVLNVKIPTHGRVLIEDPAVSFAGLTLVGCHGYAQSAEAMLDEMRRIPGSDAWRLVSIQALHRFYARGNKTVVASWMTRQDREEAIADNIEYVDRALADVVGDEAAGTLVFLGFSQGASMAARAATLGSRRAAGLVMLGGDIPPEVRENTAAAFPPVLIGVGSADTWYAGERVDGDIAFLQSRGISHDVVRFEGGHEFTDAFRTAAGTWIAGLV